MELTGKTALVTGASRGIGASVARSLGALGAHVVVHGYRNMEAAQVVCQDILGAGGTAEALCFDMGDGAEVEGRVRALTKARPVDVLVHSAGISRDQLMPRLRFADLEEVMGVNLTGALACTKAVVRGMMQRRWGRIVFLSSVVAAMGNPGQVAYSASKSALEGAARSLAREYGKRGITVNCVAPGFIETDMTRDLGPEIREKIVTQTPLGRVGTPEDVAAVVGFLVGRGGAYMTGQVLRVDGGMYM